MYIMCGYYRSIQPVGLRTETLTDLFGIENRHAEESRFKLENRSKTRKLGGLTTFKTIPYFSFDL